MKYYALIFLTLTCGHISSVAQHGYLTLTHKMEVPGANRFHLIKPKNNFITLLSYSDFSFLSIERSSGIIHEFPLSKGRGPGEVNEVIGFSLNQHNHIVVNSPSLFKVVHFTLDGELVKEQILPKSVYGRLLDSKEDRLFFSAQVYYDKPFQIVQPNNSVLDIDWGNHPFSMKGKNPFSMVGRFTSGSDRGYYIPQYDPIIHIFSLADQTHLKSIRFDENEVKYPDIQMMGGAPIAAAPERTKMFIHDAEIFPGHQTKLLILLEGQGKDGTTYSKSQLRVVDWQQPDTKPEIIDFGFTITDLSVSGEELFIYSADRDSLYIYRAK